MSEAEPTCPNCQVQGVENIKSKRSIQSSKTKTPWFFVVYCSKCGHIHSIMPKHVFAETTTNVVISEKTRD